MKGVVFTQFLEMVEEKFGFDTVDEIIERSGVKGVYTQAGNYPAEELLSLVKELSNLKGVSQNELICAYGKHLFPILIKIYPEAVKRYKSTFDFISNVDNVVHPEVKKLYPDSDLPQFEEVSKNETELKVKYRSNKPLMEFAKGLILSCSNHYNEKIDVTYEKPQIKDGMFNVLFILTKHP